ncbi:hypothetical protein JCM14076_23660 [Methylosoma difficile]
MMEWVLLRFLQKSPLLSPHLSGLHFGLNHAEVAELSGSIETGSGLLSAQLQDVTISYDLHIPKVSSIRVSHAQLGFALNTGGKSSAKNSTPLGTLTYPLERLSIDNLDLAVTTQWGLSHFIGNAEIVSAGNNLLQAHLQTADTLLTVDLSPGFRTAKVIAKQTTGNKVFELDAERLDQADKQAHLRANVGLLGAWLNTHPLIPEQIREHINTSTKAWITPELALGQLDINLKTPDNFATLESQALLTRDNRYLARLDLAMANGVANAKGQLDMTVMEMRGLLQPWQPELMREWQLTSGQVQGVLQLRWQPQRPIVGTALVNLYDVSVLAGSTQIKQASMNVQLPDLNRPEAILVATLPAISLGKKLAVQDFAVKAHFHDGQVSIERSGGALFGGQLHIVPATFDLKHRPLLLTLQLAYVDLAQLLATLDYPNLSGSGRVSGELPLSISEKSVELLDGTLTGTQPGVLRYQGPIADKENMAFKALRNLTYRSLNATVNYHPNGDYQMALRLEGSNPDVLSGHALAFNLKLSGQLPELLQKGIMAGDFDQAILKAAQGQPLPASKKQRPRSGDHQTKPPAVQR